MEILNLYSKIIIISTEENLYEKFAINNFKKYVNGDYYLHSKTVSRKGKFFDDWRNICDYFTLTKWRLSLELLEYSDCVGINLKQFPKIHYSGNYWWTKSEHLNKLSDINNNYLSPEMYILSYEKTNNICIYQNKSSSTDNYFNSNIYSKLSDNQIIDNITVIPQFNVLDKIHIDKC